jgi:hypothetical protein
MDNRITIALISAALGAFLLYWFFWPEFETKTEIVEVKTSDTVYVTVRDTIRITKKEIKHEFLRDTIIQDYTPKISLFTASKPFLYGNIYLSGEVLGEVLKMDVTQDFQLPTVTNTITRTETITKTEKPRGLYLGAGATNNLTPFAQLHYLDKQFIFSGSYSLDRTISIGVSKKIF